MTMIETQTPASFDSEFRRALAERLGSASEIWLDATTEQVAHHLIQLHSRLRSAETPSKSKFSIPKIHRHLRKKISQIASNLAMMEELIGWMVHSRQSRSLMESIARTNAQSIEPLLLKNYGSEFARAILAAIDLSQATPEHLEELLGIQDNAQNQFVPSKDPFLNHFVPFASPPPAFGAVKAIFQAARGWDLDEDERPRFVHAVNGKKIKGAFSYHVILPENTVGEMVPLAQKELAFEILRDMGSDTVWLHVALLAYAIETHNGQEFVIPSQRVHRLFGLDRRKDLTAEQKDLFCFRQIELLRRLGIAVLRLEVNGESANYRRRLGSMWDLALEEYGQRYLIPQLLSGSEDQRWTREHESWQLIGRPGIVWANLFLYNEDAKPIRQFGALARAMLENIDRHRAPLAAALAIMLTFFSRFGGKERIPITNRQVLEFGGEDLAPKNRDRTRKIKNRLLNAIEEQRSWGWTPDYNEWPSKLRPDVATNLADGILDGDGSEATPKNLPRGYWEQLLQCRTWYVPPPALLSQNVLAKNQETRGLPEAKSKIQALYTASQLVEDLKELQRLGLSQRKVAQLLDISPSLISHWRKGERKVPEPYRKSLHDLIQTKRLQEC